MQTFSSQEWWTLPPQKKKEKKEWWSLYHSLKKKKKNSGLDSVLPTFRLDQNILSYMLFWFFTLFGIKMICNCVR